MEATKRYIREAVANNGIEIEAIAIDCILKDHVHVFASFPPRLSASEVVNILKGYSSRYLRMEFPWLKQLYQQDQLWARSVLLDHLGQRVGTDRQAVYRGVPGLIHSAVQGRRRNHSVSPA